MKHNFRLIIPPLAALIGCAVLGGCSGPAGISLMDPQTRQTVQCSADPWLVWEWDQARYNEDCAQKYERAGFVRLK